MQLPHHLHEIINTHDCNKSTDIKVGSSNKPRVDFSSGLERMFPSTRTLLLNAKSRLNHHLRRKEQLKAAEE